MTARIKLQTDPYKMAKAWNIDLGDQGKFWIPYTCIFSYNPITKTAEIETWILQQKGIKFKV